MTHSKSYCRIVMLKFYARVVKSADTTDLKSVGLIIHTGSSPVSSTIKTLIAKSFQGFYYPNNEVRMNDPFHRFLFYYNKVIGAKTIGKYIEKIVITHISCHSERSEESYLHYDQFDIFSIKLLFN